MYRYINGEYAYELINNWAFIIAPLCSLFLIRSKVKAPNIFARYFGEVASRKSEQLGKRVFIFILILELYLSARQVLSTPILNKPFGDLVGTGANYFGSLFTIPIVILVLSLIFVVNPLKNSDIYTMILPIFLSIVKLACFCNGCCWGIEWEHSFYYNQHPYHRGLQVPVQAMEMFCALGIFVFLLIYRKKAKPGKLLPMYIILYSVTRFPIEFLSAAHKRVIGPFNTYHLLCVAGVIYGLIMLVIVTFFGEKITALYEKLDQRIDAKIAQRKTKKTSYNKKSK